MSIFQKRSDCVAVPGWLCVRAHVQTGVHMSDEVFAIWKAGLIILSLKLCSGQKWLGMPQDAKAKKQIKRRQNWEKLGKETDNENLEITHNKEDRESLSQQRTGILPPHFLPITLSTCLISYEEKYISRLMQANIQTTQIPPASLSDTFCYFCVCVSDSELSVFSTNLWSHTENCWDELSVCQVSARREILRRLTLSSWPAGSGCYCLKTENNKKKKERVCPWAGCLEMPDSYLNYETGVSLYTLWTHMHTHGWEAKDGNHNSVRSNSASLTDLSK